MPERQLIETSVEALKGFLLHQYGQGELSSGTIARSHIVWQ